VARHFQSPDLGIGFAIAVMKQAFRIVLRMVCARRQRLDLRMLDAPLK
jgi:hypothetical protein